MWNKLIRFCNCMKYRGDVLNLIVLAQDCASSVDLPQSCAKPSMCAFVSRDSQGVLACCNPIPSLVRQNINQIQEIISKAKQTPLTKVRVGSPVIMLIYKWRKKIIFLCSFSKFSMPKVNSLWPGRFWWNFKLVFVKPITVIDGWDTCC